MLKNTIGIVNVSLEFLESGVYAAVAKAIPFNIVGMTTFGQNANGQAEIFLLSIMVLTSDDCEFSYSISEAMPAEGCVDEITQNCFKDALSKLTESAKLAIFYAPVVPSRCSPHMYLEAMAKVDESIPVFGSLAAAELARAFNGETRTLCGEEIYADKQIIILISGINPEFYVGSVTHVPAVISNVGEVTAANGNYVTEINDTKINDIFEKVGYKSALENDRGAITSVFVINEKDSEGKLTPIGARGLYFLLDGVGIFGGSIPVGSVLSLVFTSKDTIATSVEDTAQRIKNETRGKTALIYICLGRQSCMLDTPIMEYEILADSFADSGLQYVASGSGGEICPNWVSESNFYNTEHNQSIIACVF